MNMTTSVPISVLRYDVDKDLLCSGIWHLPFKFFYEIIVENKSLTVYLVQQKAGARKSKGESAFCSTWKTISEGE